MSVHVYVASDWLVSYVISHVMSPFNVVKQKQMLLIEKIIFVHLSRSRVCENAQESRKAETRNKLDLN